MFSTQLNLILIHCQIFSTNLKCQLYSCSKNWFLRRQRIQYAGSTRVSKTASTIVVIIYSVRFTQGRLLSKYYTTLFVVLSPCEIFIKSIKAEHCCFLLYSATKIQGYWVVKQRPFYRLKNKCNTTLWRKRPFMCVCVTAVAMSDCIRDYLRNISIT